MDDAKWKHLTTVFPKLLEGARFDDAPLPTSTAEQPPFICGAFSPDDTLVALSGGGRMPSRPGIWIARVPSLETVRTIWGEQGVHALAWHAETGLLASASNGYTSVLWDVGRSDHAFVCGGDDEPIVKGHVAFARDALYVGETEAFQGNRARLLRASLGTGAVDTVRELVADKSRLAVTALSVEPESERWAFVEDDFDYRGRAKLVVGRWKTNEITETMLAPEASVVALGWRDGHVLYATSHDETGVRLHAARVERALHPEHVDRAALTLDGRGIALAHGDRITAMLTDQDRTVWSIGIPSLPTSYRTTLLAWSRSGKLLLVAGFGLVAILDTATGKIVKRAEPPAWFAARG